MANLLCQLWRNIRRWVRLASLLTLHKRHACLVRLSFRDPFCVSPCKIQLFVNSLIMPCFAERAYNSDWGL